MTPDLKFVFKKHIEDMITGNEIVIDGNHDVDIVRGISLKESDRIFINLGAIQWQLVDDDEMSEMMAETIIHEYIHLLLKDYTSIGNSDIEEHICKVLANQEGLRFIENSKTKTLYT